MHFLGHSNWWIIGPVSGPMRRPRGKRVFSCLWMSGALWVWEVTRGSGSESLLFRCPKAEFQTICFCCCFSMHKMFICFCFWHCVFTWRQRTNLHVDTHTCVLFYSGWGEEGEHTNTIHPEFYHLCKLCKLSSELCKISSENFIFLAHRLFHFSLCRANYYFLFVVYPFWLFPMGIQTHLTYIHTSVLFNNVSVMPYTLGLQT